MTLDLAAIEAHDARMGAAWWCDRAHELLAVVRTLEAERDQAQAQAEDCVAVVDLWQAKGVKYEARVTALEEALREIVDFDPAEISKDVFAYARQLATIKEKAAAALLTKEGDK